MSSKQYRKYPEQKKKRNKERRRNYVKGRFGNRRKVGKNFTKFEMALIGLHIIPDRLLAKWFGSSVNGIQSARWRIKVNYGRLYGK